MYVLQISYFVQIVFVLGSLVSKQSFYNNKQKQQLHILPKRKQKRTNTSSLQSNNQTQIIFKSQSTFPIINPFRTKRSPQPVKKSQPTHIMSSNNTYVRFKKQRPTPAEEKISTKYHLMKSFQARMANSPTVLPHPPSTTTTHPRRQMANASGAGRQRYNTQTSEERGHSRSNSSDNSIRLLKTGGGQSQQRSDAAHHQPQSNIQINIDTRKQNINTVHHNSKPSRRRTRSRQKSRSKDVKHNGESSNNIMNSSLSKLLDRQIIQKSSKEFMGVGRNKFPIIDDSLTQKVFNGEKIFLGEGKMAYKPLGMETVVESIDEGKQTKHYGQKWKSALRNGGAERSLVGNNNLQSQINYNHKHPSTYTNSANNNYVSKHQSPSAPRTLEQNIALQQRLELASAEELVSFPKQPQEQQFFGANNPNNNILVGQSPLGLAEKSSVGGERQRSGLKKSQQSRGVGSLGQRSGSRVSSSGLRNSSIELQHWKNANNNNNSGNLNRQNNNQSNHFGNNQESSSSAKNLRMGTYNDILGGGGQTSQTSMIQAQNQGIDLRLNKKHQQIISKERQVNPHLSRISHTLTNSIEVSKETDLRYSDVARSSHQMLRTRDLQQNYNARGGVSGVGPISTQQMTSLERKKSQLASLTSSMQPNSVKSSLPQQLHKDSSKASFTSISGKAPNIVREIRSSRKTSARMLSASGKDQRKASVQPSQRLRGQSRDNSLEEPSFQPAMPQRMRSNATFQPTPSKEKILPAVDPRLSHIVNDYGLHMKNQQRIQTLMDLLSQNVDSKSVLAQRAEQLLKDDDLSQHNKKDLLDQQSQSSKLLPDINIRINDQSTNYQTHMNPNQTDFSKKSHSQAVSKLGKHHPITGATDELYVDKKISIDSASFQTKTAGIENSQDLNSQQSDFGSNTKFRVRKTANLSNLKNISPTKQIQKLPTRSSKSIGYKNFMDQQRQLRSQNEPSGFRQQQQSVRTSLFQGGAKNHNEQRSGEFDNQSYHSSQPGSQSHYAYNTKSQNAQNLSSKKAYDLQSMRSGKNQMSKMLFDQTQQQQQPDDMISYYTNPASITQGPKSHSVVKLRNQRQNNQGVFGMNHRTAQGYTSNSRGGATDQKEKNGGAQSLHFGQALSYVMIKGKVQPAENYIFRQMMPYTKIDQGTVAIKSKENRHKLEITQMDTKSANEKQQNSLIGSKQNSKLKKKMQKHLKAQKDAKISQLSTIEMKQRKQRGGAIVEEQSNEGYSDHEGGDPGQSTPQIIIQSHNYATWQELASENEDIKAQILNQIAIFEQYLKVAILQQKAHNEKMKEQERQKQQAKRQNKRNINSNYGGQRGIEEELFSEHGPTEFSFLKEQNRALKDTYGPQQKAMIKKYNPSTISTLSQHHPQNNNSSHQRSSKQLLPKTPRQVAQSKSNSKTMTISPNPKSQISLKSAKKGTPTHAQIVAGSGKVKSSAKALQVLIPDTSLVFHQASHKQHSILIEKIQFFQAKLNKHRDWEVKQIHNQIRENKRYINTLTRDNLFELDVNSHDQRMYLAILDSRTKKDRRLKKSSDQKKIQFLQQRIREEMEVSAELNTWGFHNLVIEYKLKIRMTEDLIDLAQRVKLKPDASLQYELKIMRQLYQQTYSDVQHFVEKRERKPWRTWDKNGYYYKPNMVAGQNLSFNQIMALIEQNKRIIDFIEPRYRQLLSEIPPFNHCNAEMITFCTNVFGNEGWLQLFQLKQLRKMQDKQHQEKKYLPPVDRIKKFEIDPDTLQARQDIDIDERQSEPEIGGEYQEGGPDNKKLPAWMIRKPKGKFEHKLATGYEPQLQNLHSGESSIGNDDPNRPLSPGQEPQILVDPTLLAENNEGKSSWKNISQRILGLGQDSRSSQEFKSKSVTPMLSPGILSPRPEGADPIEYVMQKQDAVEARKAQIAGEREYKQSKWLQVLAREREEREQRLKAERDARAMRLAALFEDENDLKMGTAADDGLELDLEDVGDLHLADRLDQGAGEGAVQDYLNKIDTHLRVEKELLMAWQKKDEDYKAKMEALGKNSQKSQVQNGDKETTQQAIQLIGESDEQMASQQIVIDEQERLEALSKKTTKNSVANPKRQKTRKV